MSHESVVAGGPLRRILYNRSFPQYLEAVSSTGKLDAQRRDYRGLRNMEECEIQIFNAV